MYAKIVSGVVERFPYTQSDLLQDHPNTSFPQNMSDEALKAHDMYRVRLLNQPAYDPATQEPEKNALPEQVGDEWVLGWHLRQKTDEELTQYRAGLAEQARRLRDDLLADSDWVVTKAVEQNAQDGLGIQVPQVWIDYRQALRDIPQQPGFPDNVTWPTAP